MARLIFPVVIAMFFAGATFSPAECRAEEPSKKADKALQITDADNGKTFKLAVGKTFDVVLQGNATTGFQWQVGKIDNDAVRQIGKVDYVPDEHPKGMVGSGGKFVIHFEVVKAAKTKIRLVYVRPWEKDSSPAKTFEATIDSENGDLVFDGTVASIEISPLPQSRKNFIVTMRVDRVVKGSFEGKTFQFRIHSPTLSGLNVGMPYTVEAKRTEYGYTVDQDQWRKPKSIVVALFTMGREAVITPYPEKLAASGMTIAQLEPLRWQRLSSGKWDVEIGGKKINLADVATIAERKLEAKPFTVKLADGREVTVTPDVEKIGRYLIPGWAFEEDVRDKLSRATTTDPAKVRVLIDIPVPGGGVPNYWKSDRVHRSVGEPLENLAKVELREKPMTHPTLSSGPR